MKPQCSVASVETLDALRELVNIGVGRAACSISELCSREVGINIPSLEFYDFDERGQLQHLQRGSALRVSQGFSGALAGQALLVLNECGARRMAGLLLGADCSPDALHEHEQAALLELGNIILGGVTGNLADQLGQVVCYELPQLQLRGIDGFVDLISDLVEPGTSRVLLIQASLSISAENISGYLVLLFTRDQLAEMISRLEASIHS